MFVISSTNTQWRNRLFKHGLMFFLCFFCLLSFAQESKRDSVTVLKNWEDRNGRNELTIHVAGLCGPESPPFDGSLTRIEANLKTSQADLNIVFDDEDYQMERILFYENDMEIVEIKKEKAVFIPFFYCGNFDNDIKVSYIIFYKNTGYSFHINFHCSEENGCKLNDDLKNKLAQIKDKNLKKVFEEKLKSMYKHSADFHITTD
ncbi:hypothetical protein [Empedobacter brevis]|uniref:hypothetical protein n=1 Tax=Empedobacter brevis TaxID=247 RepID=UPI002896A142|nr:hypothetical protein [Empedobacter brevis]